MNAHQCIPVDSITGGKVELLARAWNTSTGEVIRRLVKHFEDSPVTPHSTPSPTADQVGVHAFYAGQKTSGVYDRESRSLTITEGPAAGRYKTPSGAATAVLQALKPTVQPNRNGWSFWVIDGTGETLQSLRGH
uniref:hypothetical protein n=1 Tax=Streptomyces sp. CA-136453 TaxID=3240050 RepID=UPI003F495CB9